MKIKRKEYAKLQQRIAYLEKMAKTRVRILDADSRPIIDADVETTYLAAKYGKAPREVIKGPIIFEIIPPEYATGYDHFLLSKYQTNAEPFDVLNKIQFSEDW